MGTFYTHSRIYLKDDLFEEEPSPTAVLLAGRFAARNHPGLEPRVLIRCLRRGLGLSQTALAERAGLRQPRVSEIESGRNEPRWREIKRLLEAMNCAPVLLAVGRGGAATPRGDDSSRG